MFFYLILSIIFLLIFRKILKNRSEQKKIDSNNNKFAIDLLRIKRKIEHFPYRSIFEHAKYVDKCFVNKIPNNSLTEEQVKSLLSKEFLNGPYGLNLLDSPEAAKLPSLPSSQTNLNDEKLIKKFTQLKMLLESNQSKLDQVKKKHRNLDMIIVAASNRRSKKSQSLL